MRLFNSNRRSFNRRSFKRLNFDRVAFARNCSFHLVAVTISTPLQRAPPLRKSIAMAEPESSLATAVPMVVLDSLVSEPLLFVGLPGKKAVVSFFVRWV